MRPIDRYFGEYGAFHRDPRNEATHALGIPMIVLAIVMWLQNVPLWSLGGVAIDLAWVMILAVSIFYIRLHVALGIAMTLVLAAFHLLGARVLGANVWIAVGLFVVGWALQFVGHAFEGKRPAFMRNGVHLLVGPMWILGRLLAHAGLGAPSGRAASSSKD
ncbi:MAG: DUF962 domain-containing protein [Blastocatellia bacterium]|nr:DUF962 domain-containing protein [Blastocatellia bacterium]